MQAEQLTQGVRVFTPDGDQVGLIERFVLDPETGRVTHVVVGGGGMLAGDKVAPFDMLSAADEGLVLSEKILELDQLPPFDEGHYVPLAERDLESARLHGFQGGPAYYWYPAFGEPGYPAYGLGRYGLPRRVAQQNVPTGTLPLEQGIGVLSTDREQVGLVKRLLVDELSDEITHFLLSRDLSYREHKLIPVRWVQSVDENFIRLHVSSQLLERLPLYERE